MSKESHELRYLEDCFADLDTALALSNFKKASEIIFAVNENYPHEAKIMNQTLQRAYQEQDVTFEPVEDSEIPFITPEEDDAPEKKGVNFEHDRYDI